MTRIEDGMQHEYKDVLSRRNCAVACVGDIRNCCSSAANPGGTINATGDPDEPWEEPWEEQGEEE